MTLPQLPMAPEPLTFAGDVSPCQANDCTLCCHDTEMPLLPADLDRLARRTGQDPASFSRLDPEGTPRLQNREGHCVFLAPTGCTVYEDRPAGCRVYPLVWDADRSMGVLDPDCPHRQGFRVRPRDRAALAALVAAIHPDHTLLD